ncbi:MAG TPA: hypothetical protein VMX12_06010 [Acidimicrobiia bacterium]|nr:hypothetical protein [Acidimicrobiia bacterium]
MARPPDRSSAPRSGRGAGRGSGRGRSKDGSRGAAPRERGPTARGANRDRAGEGGFGPFGAPQVPERERRSDDTLPERAPAPLRVKGSRAAATERTRTSNRSAAGATDGQQHARRRRGRAPDDVEREILRLGGRRGEYLLREVMAAADAYAHQRDRETLRRLRPVRDAVPDSPTVRELLGLAHYRLGNYRAAATELHRFVEMTDTVEQHPVLMDCYRAQKRWKRLEELWDELAVASPSAELVTEGRIVAAGALADRGRLDEAIAVLDRKAAEVRRPKVHHLRLWYTLADLEERSGNHARARSLFDRIAAYDREFADVAARKAALR